MLLKTTQNGKISFFLNNTFQTVDVEKDLDLQRRVDTSSTITSSFDLAKVSLDLGIDESQR